MSNVTRLPAPVTDLWDWQLQGACRGMASSWFFHPRGERGPARARREARAKQICQDCPVLARCRSHALSVREPYGVWGGLSESERSDLLHGRDPALHVVRTERAGGWPVTTALTRTDDEAPHQVCTVIEIAAMLRVSRATVYRLVHAGHLQGMRIGKSLRISRQAVEDYVRNSSLPEG